MRRAVQAFIISGVLLSAAACGTAQPAPGEPGAGIGSATAAPAGAPQSTEGSTKSSCEALGRVYSRHMAPLAQALTELADARKTAGDDKANEREVQKSLTAFASAIRGATQDSADPALRADGRQTADRLQAKTAAAAFNKVKTSEDVNAALSSTLKGWLSPVEKHCS